MCMTIGFYSSCVMVEVECNIKFRIFALSSLLSSVLIYNLPETVKEADIEKLSFAGKPLYLV